MAVCCANELEKNRNIIETINPILMKAESTEFSSHISLTFIKNYFLREVLTTTTGIGESCTTRSAFEPTSKCDNPVRP